MNQTERSTEVILVEAESFQEKGGWVVDQQFMDQMGSPYLLAHGLGVPVRDATTTVSFPTTGEYRVFVRTKDWVAPHGPGRFRLVLDGSPLPATFGTEGDGQWIWQDGGTVRIDKDTVKLALQDLSGFDGRCDAVLFAKTSGEEYVPPSEPEELAAFRRKALGLPETPPDAGEYDLVVVGGGFAGACAAIAAARMELKVALLQDRPVLGGNNSSEVRVELGGENDDRFPHNNDIVEELRPGKETAKPVGHYNDEERFRVVRAEKNLALFMNTHACSVETDSDRITAVIARNILTGEELKFTATFFVDCTGDATVGYLAGADCRFGRESRDETHEAFAPEIGDKKHLGTTNLWYAAEGSEPSEFPECPWALQFTEQSVTKPGPYNLNWQKMPEGCVTSGGWNWESGFDRDPIEDAEYIRDHNFRAIYGTWNFYKNHSKVRENCAKWKLEWIAYVAGKRESRRLLGDHILNQNDIYGPTREIYPDGCVTATWWLDLHFPHPENSRYFPGEEFQSIASSGDEQLQGTDANNEAQKRDVTVKTDPYPIPFRCLYSRNVANLMMAGRNISVTHVALGPVRVMRTTGMMGVVVGRAAALCMKHNCDPRGLYEHHLSELKRLLRNPEAP